MDERARTIQAIRGVFALWGYPVDDYTDEEVEEGYQRLSEAVRGWGLTAQEAVDAWTRLVQSGMSSMGEEER